MPTRSVRLASFIAAAFIFASAGCDSQKSQIAAANPTLAQVEQGCVEAMLKSTCQVMAGPVASNTASVVFVAGIGPVDAKAYGVLRASGEAMCSVVKNVCQKDWEGAQCRTARGLWAGADSNAK